MELEIQGLTEFEALKVLYWTIKEKENPDEHIVFGALPESVVNQTPLLARTYIGCQVNAPQFMRAIRSDYGVTARLINDKLHVEDIDEDIAENFQRNIPLYRKAERRITMIALTTLVVALIVFFLLTFIW